MTQVQRTMDHLRKAIEKSSGSDPTSTVRDWMQPIRDINGSSASTSAAMLDVDGSQLVKASPATLTSHRLIAASDENPAILDRYRLLRTRVQQTIRQKKWDVVGVTSSAPEAGKTLTTLNLAITFARAETTRVIVIDADLRKPSIASTFGVDVKLGLADYLNGEAEIEDILHQVEGLENFAFIPGSGEKAGSIANPSELLASQRFDTLLKTLRSSGALIFIDTPPLQIGDDVLSVAQRTDCFLIVVEEGRTTVQELKEAAALLRDHNVIGTVLNKSSILPKRFQSYYATGDKPEATQS